MPEYRAELKRGELIQILADWVIGTIEINALLAGGKTAKPSAQAFANYLVTSFRKNNTLEVLNMTVNIFFH